MGCQKFKTYLVYSVHFLYYQILKATRAVVYNCALCRFLMFE